MFRKWKGMGLTPPVLALLLFADIFVFNEEGLDSVVSSWHQFGESQRQDTRTDMLAVRSRSTDQLPVELRGTGDTKIQGEISRKSLFFSGEVAVRCWSLRFRGLNSSPTMTQCGVICGIAGADHEPRIALAALAQVLPSAFLICCRYQTVPFHWTMHQRNISRPDQTRRGVGIWKVPTALLNFEYIRGRPFWEGVRLHVAFNKHFGHSVNLDWALGVPLDALDAIDCAIYPFQSHCASCHENSRAGKEQNPLACRKESENGVWIPGMVSIYPVCCNRLEQREVRSLTIR